MSAVEEIQAAIEKLTELRDERGYVEMNGWLAEIREGATGAIEDPGYEGLTNDPIIVTLHRTIDAQLAILEAAVGEIFEWEQDPDVGYKAERMFKIAATGRAALDLARAINGGTQ